MNYHVHDDIFFDDDGHDFNTMTDEDKKNLKKLSSEEIEDIQAVISSKLSDKTLKGLAYFLQSCKSVSHLCKLATKQNKKDKNVKLVDAVIDCCGAKKGDEVISIKISTDKNSLNRDWLLYQIEKNGKGKTVFSTGKYNHGQGKIGFSTKNYKSSPRNAVCINGEHITFPTPTAVKSGKMLLLTVDFYNGGGMMYELYLACKKSDFDECRKQLDEYSKQFNLFKGRFVVIRNGDTEIRDLQVEIPLDKIVLPKELTDEYDFIGNLIENSEHIQDLGIKRGLLITGEPGTGKTSSLKAVLKKYVGMLTIFAIEGSIDRSPIHSDGLSLSDVYEIAERCGPSVIVFEDFDAIAIGDRRQDKNVSQILNLLCGEVNYNKVITIATSNMEVKEMDPAIIRPGRFDRHIKVLLPDKEQLKDIIKNHAGLNGFDREEAISIFNNMGVIGRKGMSGAHIASYFKTALQKARIEKRSLSKDDIIWAIGKINKSGVGFE